MRQHSQPFVFYFHLWEMDPEQPIITAAPLLQRIRHYRNLRGMPQRIRDYLSRYRFQSISTALALQPVPTTSTSVTPLRQDTIPVAASDVLNISVPADATISMGSTPGSGRIDGRVVCVMANNRENLDGARLVLRSIQGAEGASGRAPRLFPVVARLNLSDFFEGSARDLLDIAASYTGLGGESKEVVLQVLPVVETAFGPITYSRPLRIATTRVGRDGAAREPS